MPCFMGNHKNITLYIAAPQGYTPKANTKKIIY